MEIYIVRHADALDADGTMSDVQRPLSEEGIEKMRKGAKGLRNLLAGSFPPLDAILTSPLLRAEETARIIAREVNDGGEVTTCPPLAGQFVWSDLLPFLTRYPAGARVALVGHEPSLGELAGWLLAPGAGAAIPLKKGSCIAFGMEEPSERPSAELLWFLTPKLLRGQR